MKRFPGSVEQIDKFNAIVQPVQKSDEWLAKRRTKLTSSDAATALGINPYKTRFSLLVDKCVTVRKYQSNENTLHGEKYEDEAINAYCTAMGKVNNIYGLIGYEDIKDRDGECTPGADGTTVYGYNPLYEFLGGSPDGVAHCKLGREANILIEVKCPLRRRIKQGECPAYYEPQVRLNMFFLGLEIGDFIEYVPGPLPGRPDAKKEFNLVRFHKDQEWLDDALPKLAKFWEEVLHWRQEGIENHPEYAKYLETLEADDE